MYFPNVIYTKQKLDSQATKYMLIYSTCIFINIEK